jgi:integrase
MNSPAKQFPTGKTKKKRSGRVFFRIGSTKHAVNLGQQVNQKHRQSFLTHLNRLVGAKMSGTKPDKDDLKWLARLPDAVHSQLHSRGLCEDRIKPAIFVDYLDAHFKSRKQLNQIEVSTTERWRTAVGHARAFFGSVSLQSVDRARVQQFRAWLLQRSGRSPNSTMSEATVRKTCSILSGAMVEAMQQGLIASNPFKAVPRNSIANPLNEVVVPAATVLKVIHSAKDPEDRLLLGLGRFAGLRIPSEIQELTWGDINLTERVLRVYSKKTKRYGKTSREFPIFPLLHEILVANKPLDATDAEHVLPKLRLHAALGVRIRRLCKAAGVKTWSKCFNMLRKSCASDWCGKYSPADVAGWLGNSVPVLTVHYLRQQTSDYTRKVAKQEAALADGGSNGGKDAKVGLIRVVPPSVASGAATDRHGRSNDTEPFKSPVITTAQDTPRSPVKTADGRAEKETHGRYRTRTCDSRRVMAVLCQLS